ncbi:MAG: hypothetical protein WA082_00715 [Candidatus Moraniibacteriota bacterium]
MGIERFGGRPVDKEVSFRHELPISGMPKSSQEFEEQEQLALAGLAAIEAVIVDSDTNERQALVSALSKMMDLIGVPSTALEELDEEGKNQVNMMVNRYFSDLATTLDSNGAKAVFKKSLTQLLG